MALTEKHRSSIYQQLSKLLGEEEASALLSQFPARELDEPVTKEFVRAEISDLRVELRTDLADVRISVAELEARIGERLREQTMWMVGTLLTGMGVAAGVASVFS